MTTRVDETSGWVIFAGTMMLMLGLFNFIYGIVLLLNNEWVVLVEGGGEAALLLFDFTTWAWILIVVGATQLFTAWGIFTGQTWARIVGIIIAIVNAAGQLAALSIYPLWALTILVLDVLVIYALSVHGDEVVG